MAVMAYKLPRIKFNVIDLNSERISKWNSENFNELPVYEPGLSEIIKKQGIRIFFQ